jgi:uncharacterized repeat protein (TIGR03806 family)
MPYGVVSPLWSDGALKERWLALPAGDHIAFAEQGAFEFPAGTVLVKHFGMALDESRPEELERLETRVLVADASGTFYGLVYRWNRTQSDAELLSGPLEETLEIVQADGSLRNQIYTYPGPGDCSGCHSFANGFALGPRTAQLNADRDYSAVGEAAQVANQLATWNNLGFFDPPLDDRPPGDFPSLASLDDDSRSLQDRVRSYWASNCSSCHHDASPYSAWDARYERSLGEQNVVGAAPSRDRGAGILLVAPGHPEQSLLYLRAQSSEPGMRMPPILRSRPDEAYVDVLRRWILGLDPG